MWRKLWLMHASGSPPWAFCDATIEIMLTPPNLCRCFLQLPAASRMCLLDTLTSNLSGLAASAESLLEEWDTATAEAILAHKSGLKMHVFLLHCLWTQAQEEADRQAVQQQGTTSRGRGGTAAGMVLGQGLIAL